jgi:MFS family permease
VTIYEYVSFDQLFGMPLDGREWSAEYDGWRVLTGAVSSPTLVYVFTLFYGIGPGMVITAVMISASDLFQGKHFGSLLGVIFLGGYFGGAFGAWLGGSLFDLTGAYQVNFLVSGMAMLVSAALIWWVRPGSVRQMRSVESL